MARQRDEDDIDDEDYLPPPRRSESGRRSASPLLMFGGLAVVALVVAGLFLFVIRSSRQVMERERQAAMAELHRFNQQVTPPGTSGENWRKALGTWVRRTTGPEDTALPHRFEFFQNMTAQVTWTRPDGSQESRHYQVDVFADERDQPDRLAVRLREGDVPKFTFQFRLVPDGKTLALKAGDGELDFTRP